MTTYFVKNWFGLSVNDEQMKDIPLPLTELVIHVTEKTVQAGCLIGGFIVAPAVHLFKKTVPLTTRIGRYGRNGMIIGLPLGPLMTYSQLKSKNADEASIYDRSYRLRRNVPQLNVDRATVLGALIGFGATQSMFGVVVGINTGILGAAFYNNVIRPKSTPAPKEKDKEKN